MNSGQKSALKHALKVNGYKSIEDLRGLGPADLIQMEGIGRALADGILAELGSEERAVDVMKAQVIPGVLLGEVNRRRPLRGTWKAFHVDTREEFDALEISDKEIAEWIDRNRKGGSKRRKGRRKDTGDLEAKAEEKFQEYLQRFEATTPNDIANLRRLSQLEIRGAEIHTQILENTDDLTSSGLQKLERLDRAMVNVSREFRELEKALGIDRAAREDAEDDDSVGAIRDGIIRAAEIIATETQEIECHCPDNKILPLMDIRHFWPTHPWTGEIKQECPNCGKIHTLVYEAQGRVASRASDFELPGGDR